MSSWSSWSRASAPSVIDRPQLCSQRCQIAVRQIRSSLRDLDQLQLLADQIGGLGGDLTDGVGDIIGSDHP